MRVVVCDANVLYPSTLRDFLIRAGMAGLARPKWTEAILDETFRNLAANRPDLDESRLARTRRLMNQAVRDPVIAGYEPLIARLTLPDKDDRHVLAAAIHADAATIVTFNLSDFPAGHLAEFDIKAQHPDQFLTRLAEANPQAMGRIAQDVAQTWRGHAATPAAVLRALSRQAPVTAAILEAELK